MVLKDWKKTSGLKWYNKDITKTCEIKELGKDGWMFISYGNVETNISKTFKTKSQAIAYAKKYMVSIRFTSSDYNRLIKDSPDYPFYSTKSGNNRVIYDDKTEKLTNLSKPSKRLL